MKLKLLAFTSGLWNLLRSSGTVRVTTAFGILCMLTAAQAQNMILNGSFEFNSASGTQFNMNNSQFNSTVANATAFGTAQEIDLITGNPYGLPPQSGSWKLAIAKQGGGGAFDAFSFQLSSAIVSGQMYVLDFYAQEVTDFQAGHGAILAGISSSATSFGTQIFSGFPSTNAWTHFVQTFTAPTGGTYLTVESDPSGPGTWSHVDNFSLIAVVPEPGTLTFLAIGFAGTALRRRNIV